MEAAPRRVSERASERASEPGGNVSTTPASRRWMGVGRSDATDSRTAALSAARSALAGTDPRLLVVFAAIDHDPAAVLDGLGAAAPGVPVIGCSTHGEIAPGGPRDGTVVVAALGGPGFAVATAVAESVSGRQREAGTQVARCARELDGWPYRVLVLLTDGLVRDQESILRGAYGVLGASMPYFGGAAADGWRMSGAYLLAGEPGGGRVLADAVVAATIASEGPLAVAVRHGYR